MKEKEILDKVIAALWAQGKATYDWAEGYAARGHRVGKIAQREWGECLFLVRVEREGEKPKDLIFFDRAERNKVVKEIVGEFKSEEEKLEAKFKAEAERELKAWKKEHKGKLATFERETEWGMLRAKALVDGRELALKWVRPEVVGGIPLSDGREGEISVGDFERILNGADRELFKRMNSSVGDTGFLDDSPLAKRSIEVQHHDSTVAHPSRATLNIEVDLPEKAVKIIAERGRRLRGE